ncbi:transposase, partial [Pseudoalteromonas sp. S554]
MSKYKRIFKLKLAQLAEQENSEALSKKYNISA